MTTRLEQSEKAFSAEHRERLRPILAQLDAARKSTFLDLCELLLMVAEGMDGSLKWDHPRITVHIRKKPRVKPSKADGVRGKPTA
jgi:hypothetical protein